MSDEQRGNEPESGGLGPLIEALASSQSHHPVLGLAAAVASQSPAPSRQARSTRVLLAKDIIVLLKLTTLGDTPWTYRELTSHLMISPSTMSDGLQTSAVAKLYNPANKQVLRANLLEFLVHGVKYAFPAERGAIVRGVPTSVAASPLVSMFPPSSEPGPVWLFAEGHVRGYSLSPIDAVVPRVALADPRMGELLALIDAIRDGRARERALAVDELKKRLIPE